MRQGSSRVITPKMMNFLKLNGHDVELFACKMLKLNEIPSHVKWPRVSYETARRFRKQAASQGSPCAPLGGPGTLQRLRPTWGLHPQLGVHVLD